MLPNTPLAALVTNSHTDDAIMSGYGEHFQFDPTVIAAVTNTPNSITGVCDHDEYMDAIVDRVANAVSRHLHVTRTQVVPAIEELVDRVRPLVEQLQRSNYSDLEVRVLKVPAPLMEPSIIESVQRSREAIPSDFTMGGKLPIVGFEDILTQMKTGAPSADEALVQYCLELGEDKVVAIYNDWFTQAGKSPVVSVVWDSDQATAYAIIGFAVARKLWNNPPEETDMSAGAYSQYMVDVRNNSALQLVRELTKIDRDTVNDVLVRQYGGDHVVVNDAVYRKWLNAGGSNEMLFGSILSTKPVYRGAQILEDGKDYIKSWNHFLLMNKTTEANKRFAGAKSIMRLEFAEILGHLSQDECPLQDREVIRSAFEKALDVTKEAEVQDLHSWACRLLCQSRFAHTDAFKILQGIAKVKALNPDVEVREAAAVATIEYIAEWLTMQVTVVQAAV